MQPGPFPVNIPELGQFMADAANIGPEPAQFWHVKACLQGFTKGIKLKTDEIESILHVRGHFM